MTPPRPTRWRWPASTPRPGATDAGQYEAILLLGQWWYENRNRPEGLDSLNPMASPYYRRVALGILQRGVLPIA